MKEGKVSSKDLLQDRNSKVINAILPLIRNSQILKTWETDIETNIMLTIKSISQSSLITR